MKMDRVLQYWVFAFSSNPKDQEARDAVKVVTEQIAEQLDGMTTDYWKFVLLDHNLDREKTLEYKIFFLRYPTLAWKLKEDSELCGKINLIIGSHYNYYSSCLFLFSFFLCFLSSKST
jgi:hypothetical protein